MYVCQQNSCRLIKILFHCTNGKKETVAAEVIETISVTSCYRKSLFTNLYNMFLDHT